MASRKTLDETSVGRELEAEFERMKKRHEAEMRELLNDITEAQKANDKKSQEEVVAMPAHLQKKMYQGGEDIERIIVAMEEQRVRMEQRLQMSQIEIEEQKERAQARAAQWEALDEQRIRELETDRQTWEAKLRFGEESAAKWEALEERQRELETDRQIWETELRFEKERAEAETKRQREELYPGRIFRYISAECNCVLN